MPLFDCGYYMKQDYIKPFVEKSTDDDYNPITLLMDINDWWFELPRDQAVRLLLPPLLSPTMNDERS